MKSFAIATAIISAIVCGAGAFYIAGQLPNTSMPYLDFILLLGMFVSIGIGIMAGRD